MFNPIATYRIQFHQGFTLRDFLNIVPYLKDLGITTIYASPIFEAVPGSVHGYDGTNPHRINPEIGTMEELKQVAGVLRGYGMYWLQDIVPNHMAYDLSNAWLKDVLEKGRSSQYAGFFDIDWDHPECFGCLMAPFLGAPLEDVIRNEELQIAWESQAFFLKYFDQLYPLNEATQRTLTELRSAEHHDDIHAFLSGLNGNKALVSEIALSQHYRLCHWTDTDARINYRRFFTINGLICLRIQDAHVFEVYHNVIRELVLAGVFQGLRIDHVDGLYDPGQYLRQLRQLAGPECYIVVEKILQPGEELPDEWPVAGTTGYDFLGIVNNLLTDKRSADRFRRFYRSRVEDSSPGPAAKEWKAHILRRHMSGELDNLRRLFQAIPHESVAAADAAQITEVLERFLAACPVYRFYGQSFPLKRSETRKITKIFAAIERRPEGDATLATLEDMLLRTRGEDPHQEAVAHFYRRLMQLSGPLMAKAVEDTLMYTYNCFIGHNEVGDCPDAFGIGIAGFHTQMEVCSRNWPLTMNATATHDTKRGEDVRARLNVLTEFEQDWFALVKEWFRMNRPLKRKGAPAINDEYFIYQTLVGVYPYQEASATDLADRLTAYIQKALREGKVHSDWSRPDEAYETACADFVKGLLRQDGPFLASFMPFHQQIRDAAIANSLTQTLLRYTCPGIPDLYQGTELWDLSLVDPDNRRPVDYEQRRALLAEIAGVSSGAGQEELWTRRGSGVVKLWLIRCLLRERGLKPAVFGGGYYLPLKVSGKYKDNIIAFARHLEDCWYIVAAPLHVGKLASGQQQEVNKIDWGNTRIILPPQAPGEFADVLGGRTLVAQGEIAVSNMFASVPLGLFRSRDRRDTRKAGVLLAITSLPSGFAVGDIGPAAHSFVRFLHNSKQRLWQILPVTPTESGSGHSPYSSYASMAGNPLLISPEQLEADGLIPGDTVRKYRQPVRAEADYERAAEIRQELLDMAFRNFTTGQFDDLRREFDGFCSREAYWLDDMSLFRALKQYFNGAPWYEWEPVYRDRNEEALASFREVHAPALDREKWAQFLFQRQWNALHAHAQSLNVRLIGDMPFYVSHDSVDVWANRSIFSLDEDGRMVGIAGVPPDYFSADGQLWGMPTYNWQELEKRAYDWWVARLKRNLALFDLLRIDHFRAFHEFWEVPAGAATAKEGVWVAGPGAGFFSTLRGQIGALPFIAEDLGDRMEGVYKLRDQLGLPGMRVLQFAFGGNMPRSVDVPHHHVPNCVVYTGTHDNNTTSGWYASEASKADIRRMERYIGGKVSGKAIHEVFGRMAFASVANTVILPMQDVLGLDGRARMNTPGEAHGNWLWRLTPDQLDSGTEKLLRHWTEIYGRE